MRPGGARSCAPRDLAQVCSWSAVTLWYLPAAALVGSGHLGDARWWIWTPALMVMGTACVANAVECHRLHCYVTGPVFLIAAALSFAQGTHLASVGWSRITGEIIVGCALGCLIEGFAVRYIASGPSERSS